MRYPIAIEPGDEHHALESSFHIYQDAFLRETPWTR